MSDQITEYAFAGDDVPWDDPAVKFICEALLDVSLDLRKLGHAHARLDANARMFIARHLVGRGVQIDSSGAL